MNFKTFTCILKTFAFSGLLLISFAAICGERVEYSPVEYLRNFALSRCIVDGYDLPAAVSGDITAAANGYLELGSLPIEAYSEAASAARVFLKKQYVGKYGDSLILMKCIDLYHSKELDEIARKYPHEKP